MLGILQPGVDYSIGLSTDLDAGGAVVVIRPLRPLVASTGGTNNGYLILVTNGVTSTTGNAATPDAEYLTIRDAAIADLTGGVNPPTCASITNATLNGVCRLTFAHLAIGSQLPGPFVVAPTSVVASWSFSTVATRDTLGVLAATTIARPYAVEFTGLTTGMLFGPTTPNLANIYDGSLNVAYRLAVPATTTSTSVLTTPWQAAGPSPVLGIDPASRHLTRFNPVPAAGTAIDIPLLLCVPRLPPKPAAGWPVVVFVHGFPRDRTDALLVADIMASRGFATIAIDLPLHGVTPSSAAYAQPFATNFERTFDLDLQINAVFGAPGQDGQVDPTGVNFLNLTNVLVQRDNSRQAIADLIALIRTLPTIDFDRRCRRRFRPRAHSHDRLFARRHACGHGARAAGRRSEGVRAALRRGHVDRYDQAIRHLRPDHQQPAGREWPAGEYDPVQQLLPQRAGGVRCGGYRQLRLDDSRRGGRWARDLYLDIRGRRRRISRPIRSCRSTRLTG